MFDLVSTRGSTDELTANCGRLLVAVIAQAIHDACERPSQEEAKQFINLKADARAAVEWLFDENDIVFTVYAKLIGANAQTIREALLSPGTQNALFPEASRRILHARYRWWRQAKSAAPKRKNKPG